MFKMFPVVLLYSKGVKLYVSLFHAVTEPETLSVAAELFASVIFCLKHGNIAQFVLSGNSCKSQSNNCKELW